MIQAKPKRCEGKNKAKNFEGCGKMKPIFSNGLCKNCAQIWYSQKNKISPVSKKRSGMMQTYKMLRKPFLNKHKICPVTGKPTTEIHHMKGRIGQLLTDTKFWLAVSREGHRKIEENPEWAKEMGYSLNRN